MQRVEYDVCSQLLTIGVAKPFHVLKMSNHIEHMSTNWLAFLKLAIKNGLMSLIPLHSRLLLKHNFQVANDGVGIHPLKPILKARFHGSQHKTSDNH